MSRSPAATWRRPQSRRADAPRPASRLRRRAAPAQSVSSRVSPRVSPPGKGTIMLAMWVKVRVKPDRRKQFLKAIEVDALGSERDEPGCYRFNVLQDQEDQNVYY